jgi:uncharacterized protein YeaO (DUF488 family)
MSNKPIQTKRVYEDAANNDGYRVLVDRIWPRGVSKEKAKLDEWMKDIAPSSDLRKWFGHDPDKFGEFKKRYKDELGEKEDLLDQLAEKSTQKKVTLLYGAKDEEHNQAVVLESVLKDRRENS